jgi:aminopeptidase YwaD
MSCSQAFRELVTGVTQRYPGVVWVDPWPESNHSTFSMRGVPALAFSAVGSRRIAHTPADTIEVISPAKLVEVANIVAELIASLQDKTPAWCRETE